jgi:hypothetical protein
MNLASYHLRAAFEKSFSDTEDEVQTQLECVFGHVFRTYPKISSPYYEVGQ